MDPVVVAIVDAECRENRRKPICPLTIKELSSTKLNPSIKPQNTIEWNQRNEIV